MIRTCALGIAALVGMVALQLGLARAATPPATPTSAAQTQSKPLAAKQPVPSKAAVLSANTIVHRDLAYGKNGKQRLDVYAPRALAQGDRHIFFGRPALGREMAKGAEKNEPVPGLPVVIFVHGGEWARHDKSEVSYKPKFLNDNRIVFVSINYRLSPAAVHPAHVSDVAAAVRWVHDHAAEFGASANKIVLMGHSAGCHLVTLVALDPRYLARVGLRPADLRGVVAWSGGAYDLVEKVRAGGMYAPYIRQAFGNSKAAWRDASPVTHVGDAHPLPRFLFISVERGNASYIATQRLVELIRHAKGQADSRVLEGRTHFTANHLLGAPGDTTGAILLDFVRQVTR